MSIRTAEDELFSHWSLDRPGFVQDGVVSEEDYLQSSLKLLFVLKEVNDSNGGGWDLRDFVREGGRRQTWDNITRWVDGIRRLKEEIPWTEHAEVDEEKRCRVLKSIAVVNLKKSPGGHTTDSAALVKIATEDKDFLNRQLALYDPDVIICCGTSLLLHQLTSFCEKPKWRCTYRGVWFHEYKADKYIVSYVHPEARCSPPLLYYGLIDAMREINSQRP
jgi:hypothetical protein